MGPPAASPAGTTLEISPFTASDAYRKVEFVYRTTDTSWETDFYNIFLLPPAVQITEEVRAAVAASGRLGQVVRRGSAVEPTHVLEGHVRALYADFRDRTAPKAVLALELTLLDLRGEAPQILSHRVYEHAVPVAGASGQAAARGEALAKGWSEALAQALAEFDAQLTASQASAGRRVAR